MHIRRALRTTDLVFLLEGRDLSFKFLRSHIDWRDRIFPSSFPEMISVDLPGAAERMRPQVVGLIVLTTLLFASERSFALLTSLLSPAVGFLDRWLPCM